VDARGLIQVLKPLTSHIRPCPHHPDEVIRRARPMHCPRHILASTPREDSWPGPNTTKTIDKVASNLADKYTPKYKLQDGLLSRLPQLSTLSQLLQHSSSGSIAAAATAAAKTGTLTCTQRVHDSDRHARRQQRHASITHVSHMYHACIKV